MKKKIINFQGEFLSKIIKNFLKRVFTKTKKIKTKICQENFFKKTKNQKKIFSIPFFLKNNQNFYEKFFRIF